MTQSKGYRKLLQSLKAFSGLKLKNAIVILRRFGLESAMRQIVIFMILINQLQAIFV